MSHDVKHRGAPLGHGARYANTWRQTQRVRVDHNLSTIVWRVPHGVRVRKFQALSGSEGVNIIDIEVDDASQMSLTLDLDMFRPKCIGTAIVVKAGHVFALVLQTRPGYGARDVDIELICTEGR